MIIRLVCKSQNNALLFTIKCHQSTISWNFEPTQTSHPLCFIVNRSQEVVEVFIEDVRRVVHERVAGALYRQHLDVRQVAETVSRVQTQVHVFRAVDNHGRYLQPAAAEK